MTYIFENAAPQAGMRLGVLADIFDETTRQCLAARGVQDGWRCLEVGGGTGTIAAWLASRVGPTGSVLVTDIDPQLMSTVSAKNLEIRHHDIESDPLPADAFDLVHARLVLSHLARPDLALFRMVSALKPGGWLVVEDFEVPPPGDGDDALSATALAMRGLTSAASDHRLGRTLARRLVHAGLEDVEIEGRARLVRGATLGARLMQANFEQLRPRLLATGLSAEQFAADHAELDDPRFEMRAPTMWTAWGRRAA
ncbi:methyltransferase [Luteitalea sp. TBR-22]|uniref:class I SAM-dependent methyltransferase n=1 Tax=Luteitalea sp. TBR-22 TaxID=2802971 RepID=UPI001AF0FE0C|nr:methyltransferase domain-containing protein [Luteitalea sp. TBR-22]BCS35067.1 methyltransferase [Luteitalea sp. TBR-22]